MILSLTVQLKLARQVLRGKKCNSFDIKVRMSLSRDSSNRTAKLRSRSETPAFFHHELYIQSHQVMTRGESQLHCRPVQMILQTQTNIHAKIS